MCPGPKKKRSRIFVPPHKEVRGRPEDLNAQLVGMTIAGKIREVRRLLRLGAEPDSDTNGAGETPLHEAVFHGHKTIAALLIDEQVKRSGSECTGSCFGFLDHYLDAPSDDFGTPLTIAVARGDEEIVELLLQCGANPCAEAEEGDTPLHVAAQNNATAIMRLLLNRLETMEAEEGIDCSPIDVPNATLGTPLFPAAEKGHLKMVRMLLSAGASVDEADAGKNTPLHMAARGGYVAVVRSLLSAGGDANATNEDGETPTLAALSNGHQLVVECLLASGGKVPKPPHRTPKRECTARHGKRVRGKLNVLGHGPGVG